MPKKKTCYAVRVGHRPGLYDSWEACRVQVEGCCGASYKGFATRAEAQAWLDAGRSGGGGQGQPRQQRAALQQQPPPQQQPQHHQPQQQLPGGKWWAVVRGRTPGVLQGEWGSHIQPLVDGFPGAKFRSFASRAEAQAFFNAEAGHSHSSGVSSSSQPPLLAGSKRQHSQMASAASEPPPAFAAGPAGAAAAGGQPTQQQQAQQQQQGSAAAAAAAGRVGMVTIFFDGGSRGNPGRAGWGYAIRERRTDQQLRLGCGPLPYGSTNNEAEYSGMIAGLRYAADMLQAQHVVVRGDSQLVVRQMQGSYKVNGPRLLPLFRQAKLLEERFATFDIGHIRREENGLADALSNLAMDTDEVADTIGAGRAGTSRRQVAMALAHKAAMDQDQEWVSKLLTAPCFMEAAAELLSGVWDGMPVDEVLLNLSDRGWTPATGGEPEREPPPPAGGGGRGRQAVAVAAVTLGPRWASEIRRQEQAMGQAAAAGGGGGSMAALQRGSFPRARHTSSRQRQEEQEHRCSPRLPPVLMQQQQQHLSGGIVVDASTTTSSRRRLGAAVCRAGSPRVRAAAGVLAGAAVLLAADRLSPQGRSSSRGGGASSGRAHVRAW